MSKDSQPAPLDLSKLLADRQLMVVGGTGFLGKVWVSLLLTRYPKLRRVHLIVRRKADKSGPERFWQEVMHNEAFAPLREQHGTGYEAFMRDKVEPIEGDIVEPHCGVSASVREHLAGDVAALVNASGIVDFEPPLDVALQVNAFGVQNLVELARSLGNCPLLHTSTCFVAGRRTGFVEEQDPRLHPFPRADELPRAHWDPDREIQECLSIIEQAKERANDAFRQSHFHSEARKNLVNAHEPSSGATLEREVEGVKRAYIEARLAEMGNERARFWGWPNTYTYTKSIGEQIAVASGLQVAIVRPAIVETSVQFPMRGWNEGINTSAPLIYAIREGQTQLPGGHHNLDMIPCDMVAGGMMMALGELLDGTAKSVYQLGASDTNPVTMARVFELTGLYKRRHHLQNPGKNPLHSAVQAHVEGALFSSDGFEKYGPKALAQKARSLGSLLRRLDKSAALAALADSAGTELEEFARNQERIGRLLTQFAPFTAEYDYTFRCDNVRQARARLSAKERADLYWEPESIDWRQWFLDVHAPALERWVFPEIEKRRRRPPRPRQHHETLTTLLHEVCARHDLAVALQTIEADGVARISYRDLQQAALACAARLGEQGIVAGDRVLLVADNEPAWPMAFFGILQLGATVVPIDPDADADMVRAIAVATDARLCVGDARAYGCLGAQLQGEVTWLDLLRATSIQHFEQAPSPEPQNTPEDIAVMVQTSGTTGSPKTVSLSHHNLTRLVAALAPIFPLNSSDRALSVLPLHRTFELVCGLLLPLSRGASVTYSAVDGDDLMTAMAQIRPTLLVGNPGTWQSLEKKLRLSVGTSIIRRRGHELAANLSTFLGKRAKLNIGRVLFASLHQLVGGELKYLLSGGGALPQSLRAALLTLGLPVREIYGLLETGQVLTVSSPSKVSHAAHIGKAIPGIELCIANADREGVGEILVRGATVMSHYAEADKNNHQVIDKEGWLQTGDVGRIDDAGNLLLVGRAREVIVRADGEPLYPDEIEAEIGTVACIDELCVVGVTDGRGRERAVCVAVPTRAPHLPLYEQRIQAKAALLSALAQLPAAKRPTEHVLLDGPLPRTSQRSVKRFAVRHLLEQREAAAKGLT